MASLPWSREEVEATVTDYLSMLQKELSGLRIEKTKHRRNLQPLLNKRSESSIEFKHQNISAVLIKLGFPYIQGYLPAANYQRLLYEVVANRLSVSQNLIAQVQKDVERISDVPRINNILDILTDPPIRKNLSLGVRERKVVYQAGPINYLEREANNQSLGRAGEEFVIEYERQRLLKNGKESLASRINHVSKSRGDSDGFDIMSFEISGKERLIEVKTTKYGKETPFFITRNELSVSDLRSEHYHLYRLFSFQNSPGLFTLSGNLSSTCILEPVTYTASAA